MLNNRKTALFCLCLVLVCKSSIAAWDFWPFNINKIKTPTVKIIPEVEGNFIHYKLFDQKEQQPYVDSINTFLNSYKQMENSHTIYCDFVSPSRENHVCVFDTEFLPSVCTRKDFGFSKAKPCIYFTLSQVPNWIPIILNGSDIQQHSDPFLNVPDYLRNAITATESRSPFQKYIWFSCDGETAADKEFIGPISYFPRQGFPTYYFPFTNIQGYQSPIVALYFESPARGVAISIECRAWAKNIELNRDSGAGYVKFQLLID